MVGAGRPIAAALAAAGAFVDAARRGDQQALLELLAPDAVLVSDGGAEQHAARRPVVGADRVCRFVLNLARRLPAGVAVEPCWVNGAPGNAAWFRGVPAFIQAFEVEDGRITPHLHREQPRQAARPGPHGPAGLRSTVGPETRGACAGLPFPTVGRSGQDSLTRVASGLLAGAVVAVLGACALDLVVPPGRLRLERAEPQVLATARAGRDRPRDRPRSCWP